MSACLKWCNVLICARPELPRSRGPGSLPLGHDQVHLYQVIRRVKMIKRGVGTRCAEGIPQCSVPLQEVIVILVPREQVRQEPEGLRGSLNAQVRYLHDLHLAFPMYCCVTQSVASHPESSGPWAWGGKSQERCTSVNIMNLGSFQPEDNNESRVFS